MAQVRAAFEQDKRDATPTGRLLAESLTPRATSLAVAGLATSVASLTIGHAFTGLAAFLMAALMFAGAAAFTSGLLLWAKVHRRIHYGADLSIWEGGAGAGWKTGQFRVPEHHAARSLRAATGAISCLECSVAVEDTVRAAVEQGEHLIDRLINQNASGVDSSKKIGAELILLSAQVEVLVERERQRVRREEFGGHLDVAARIEALAIASDEAAPGDARSSEADGPLEVTT